MLGEAIFDIKQDFLVAVVTAGDIQHLRYGGLNFRGTKSNWQSLDLTINSNDTRLQMETDVADSNWRMLIPTDIKVTDYARWNTDGLVR